MYQINWNTYNSVYTAFRKQKTRETSKHFLSWLLLLTRNFIISILLCPFTSFSYDQNNASRGWWGGYDQMLMLPHEGLNKMVDTEKHILIGTFVLINSFPTSVAVVNWVVIGFNNGWSPVHGQAIIWTDDDLLSIRYMRTNFDQILLKIHKCSLKTMPLKISYAKCHSLCLGPVK